MKYSFLHSTPTSKIEINLVLKTTTVDELKKYEDKPFFSELCENGCVNYNRKWSCPPYSPSYSVYTRNYRYGLLILLFCELSQFSYVKTEYMKVKTSNLILKSQSDRLSWHLESALNGKMLSNGSCRLCKPCSKKASADSCKNPLKLRYSLEALGLNVEKVSQDLFNHELLWYGKKLSPNYSSVISAVLTNSNLNQLRIKEHIKNYGLISNTNFVPK